ncbi:MAG: MoaD/ThiS family protein [Candidatus Saccharicenans sp.]|nr:MoaD/ThiS family protein [Candidatus Saccharicenans sp.]
MKAKQVTFRFYEELNDYLPEDCRKRDFEVSFDRPVTVGKAIESLGVPRAEVDLILVNGRSVSFRYRLKDGDRVSVYPIFEQLDISGVTKVRKYPLLKLKPNRRRSKSN